MEFDDRIVVVIVKVDILYVQTNVDCTGCLRLVLQQSDSSSRTSKPAMITDPCAVGNSQKLTVHPRERIHPIKAQTCKPISEGVYDEECRFQGKRESTSPHTKAFDNQRVFSKDHYYYYYYGEKPYNSCWII